MHKIYSRPRIIIPKIRINSKSYLKTNKGNGETNNKKRKVIEIFFVLIIAFSTLKLVLDAVLPIFDTLCEDKAKSIATIVLNEEARNVIDEYSYDELFTIEKDNSGNIVMLRSNVVLINKIVSDLSVKIQNRINEQGRDNLEIALGSFTGIKLLSGKGPGVKLKISSIGSVETDLKSEFESKGINQTIHRVYLQINCKINILTPFENNEKEITNQILLLENVIVGNIPDTYYNLEGMNSSDDTLNVIQ